jgi:hypothetical protein
MAEEVNETNNRKRKLMPQIVENKGRIKRKVSYLSFRK